jgi:hypothetical protein
MYVCKMYANGQPGERKVFQTLLEAERWACREARVENGVRYTVSIYNVFSENVDTSFLQPIKIILE